MSYTNLIRLLIAEYNSTLRRALDIYFRSYDDIQVVGLAADHVQALTLVRQLNPDVLLIDPIMKPKNSLTLLHTLRQESPDTKIVVLTSAFNDLTPASVIEAGAVKYVEKGELATDMATDIRQVYRQYKAKT